MIRINQIKLPIGHSNEDMVREIRKRLRLKEGRLDFEILKRSIDARKKPNLFYIYSVVASVDNEKKVLAKLKDGNITPYKKNEYLIPYQGEETLVDQPVIVGAGPAGLFCAFILAEAGFKPIVLERGACVEERTKEVSRFWETGELNPTSNVQFGEGGAGTFSDGKLNTSVKDPSGRNAFVLNTFVRFGAGSDILYENKPHIGTDVLSEVIVNMRKYLVDKGVSFLFKTKAEDFVIENGRITSVTTAEQSFKTSVCVLALGHSARDTFDVLKRSNLGMEAKSFAVGFRVEHPQSMIDEQMYGKQKKGLLPAAPYKVTSNFPNGRGVYSFCMCPGGYVVNSSSEPGYTAVNGMSYSGRDGANANSAIIVSVGPNDFGSTDALSGVRFQERLERECFKLAGGKIPSQLFGDFCDNRASASYGDFISQTKGEAVLTNLRGLFSPEVESSFILGMEHFGKIITGFDRKDAILSGVESRTSSPVRINRDEAFESNIKGIYPCGEGAGYAGGIMSAAMDGMKVAEAILSKYRPA